MPKHHVKPLPAQLPATDAFVNASAMTLRDYLAACALQGGISEFYRAGDTWSDWDDFAESCYHVADAMMRERMK